MSVPFLEPAPFTDDELDQYLAYADADDLPEAAQPVDRWSVTDAGSAEWAMARLADARAEVAAARAQAAVWKARVDEWLAAETSRPASFATFLEHHLEQYALDRRAADPKATNVKVPSGKVTTRRSGPRPVIAEDLAVLDWLDGLGDDCPDGAIKRAPLVSKFVDLITIAERPTGRLVAEVACCGAVLTLDTTDGREVTDGALLCSNCGAEGEVVHVEEETALVPVDPNGEVVPGVIIEPEKITATVTPQGG